MRGDEADFHQDDRANKSTESEKKPGPFFRNSHSKKSTSEGSRTNPTPRPQTQKQTYTITDLEEIKQAEISEQQKTVGGNNIIQQSSIQPATNCKQIPSDNTVASDTTTPICPIKTTTILAASSNSNPVTSSNDNSTPPDATSIPTAKPACQSNKCTLSLLIFNVEGYRSNKLYLEQISNRADIICVQEHLLYKHEKHRIFRVSMSCKVF
ncbi:unnamed protein product [Mytilus coruscus]|uniref:Endonuclease/exonuclease/phosphatase domain-containing protein n=1 Tax=Mytilus coruscus TaxID=42192 RepID=A0A6J8ACE4_MYTCO|nr:unnamed protein product [Mytilus coruscus]